MYGKIFASIYQGTLRGQAHAILVFTNMIACADKDGGVDKHFRAIAEEVGLTIDQVKTAIEYLEAPDPESRSREAGGARVVRVDEERTWGWRIINYGKYREIRNADERRTQNREAQERFRQNADSKQVAYNKQNKPMQRQRQKQMQMQSVNTTREAPAAPPAARALESLGIEPKTEPPPEAIQEAKSPESVDWLGGGENTHLESPANGISKADQWRYKIVNEPWAKKIDRARLKIGPQNWPQWQGLLEDCFKDDVDALVNFAKTINAERRWPDHIEEEWRKRRPDAAASAKGQEVYIL